MADILYGFDASLIATDAAGNVSNGATFSVHTTYSGSNPFTATKAVNPVTLLPGVSTGGVVTADSLGRVGFFAADYTGTLYLRQGANSWPVKPTLASDFDVSGLATTAALAAAIPPKPALAQAAIQYVSTAGNNANDGLTMGTAKATVAAAVTALRANGGGVIQLGKGSWSVPATIDLTNLLNIEIRGMGSRITSLILNTGPIGIDLTGTSSWRIKGIRLYTIGQTNLCTTAILMARSTVNTHTEFSHLSDVWIQMHSDLTANGGAGTIGVLNNAAELAYVDGAVYILADRPYVCTKSNIYGHSSAFTTRVTVTSMSVVEISGSPTFMAMRGPAITLEGTHNFSFHGYCQGAGSAPNPAAPYAVEVVGSMCSDIELRGSFEQFTGILRTTQLIQNLQLVGRAPHTGVDSLIMLDGSSGSAAGIQGGRVDILPGGGSVGTGGVPANHALIDDGTGVNQYGVYDLDIHLYASQSIDAPTTGFGGCSVRADADSPVLNWIPERRGNVVLTRTYTLVTGQLRLFGPSATLAAGANNGATPPTPNATTSANSNRGDVQFGSGTTPAAGAQVTVTFGVVAYPVAPKVVISAGNLATLDLDLYVSAKSTTGFTVSSKNAPAASQANTVYKFDYVVLG